MTQSEFLDWAAQRDDRFEFDGVGPVAMTGGTRNHSRLTNNLLFALRSRLQGASCEVLGPDAGVATIGDAVRYPDALVTCTAGSGDDRLIDGVLVVCEVLSPSSGHNDRIVKVREYGAVPSIRRYVLLEHAIVAATMFHRVDGVVNWTATTLVAGEMVPLPEIGIEVPLSDLYAGTGLPETMPEDGR